MIFPKQKNQKSWPPSKTITKVLSDVFTLILIEITYSQPVMMMVNLMSLIWTSQAEKNMPKWLLSWKVNKESEQLHGLQRDPKLLQVPRTAVSPSGTLTLANQYTYYNLLIVISLVYIISKLDKHWLQVPKANPLKFLSSQKNGEI